jgi:HSP20 family protein
MMTLYVSPNRRIARLRKAMDHLVDENYQVVEVPEREKILAVDVISDDEAYTISALIPGVEAEDINVEILNKTVTIQGEFKDTEQEDEKYLMCELPSGKFGRRLTLPTVLDPAKAEASLENGVFSLRVPKAEDHLPKKIEISVN